MSKNAPMKIHAYLSVKKVCYLIVVVLLTIAILCESYTSFGREILTSEK